MDDKDLQRTLSGMLVKVIVHGVASMSEQQYLRKLVKVTVEHEHTVVRHLECGHVNKFEALCGEAESLAADARKLIGTRDYCAQCAAKES